MEWQLVHHPRNVESVQSLSFTGLGYNAHAGTVTIGPDDPGSDRLDRPLEADNSDLEKADNLDLE